MTTIAEHAESLNESRENVAKTTFGFWVYLMTDCILFASLFATYAVLHGNLNGGPDGKELFNLPVVLLETFALLLSSFSCGLCLLAARSRDKRQAMLWLGVTAVLGLCFLGIELNEFHHLAADGNSWQRSGFLSAFFTLVGTHGLHITVGLMWLLVLATNIMRSGLTSLNMRRLALFSIFWHFLDLIWIFIFTVVYLFGGLGL